MAKDDVTLNDIDPADQRRLARWLTKSGSTLSIIVDEAEVVVTGNEGPVVGKDLNRALASVMELRGEPVRFSRAFQRRLRAALGERPLRLTITSDGDEFTVVLSDVGTGGRSQATDIDFEIALVLAEEELRSGRGDEAPTAVRAVAAPDAPTLAGRTIRSPALSPETEPPTIAADTVLVDEETAPPTMRAPPLTLASSLAPNRRWTRRYIDELPDDHFLHVEPGGVQDERGRSHPLSLRHFPFMNSAGHPSYAHLVNALSRIPQSHVPDSAKRAAMARARRVLDLAGYTANDSERRLPARSGHRPAQLSHLRRMTAEEERRRQVEQRPFDPARPRTRYARPHHFAINADERDILRDVLLGDTGYRLVLWDTHRMRGQHTELGYAFFEPGVEDPLFEGEDFGASPMQAIDSDATVPSLLGFLTLRPGGTDAEDFRSFA